MQRWSSGTRDIGRDASQNHTIPTYKVRTKFLLLKDITGVHLSCRILTIALPSRYASHALAAISYLKFAGL